MPINLSNNNIIIDYGSSNFTIETVKSKTYTDKDTIGLTSNLLAEPILETISRMYPSDRSFTNNTKIIDNNFFKKVDSKYRNSVILTNSGKVYSYGYNNYGQLGLGDINNYFTPQPISAFNNLNISAIACGQDHTVFLTNDGKVYSCGRNNYGQLGISTNSGTETANPTPTLITTTTSQGTAFNNLTISDIACGGDYTLFLTNTGNVYACGYNVYGQLGLGDTSHKNVPTLITALNSLTITAISCGYYGVSLFLTNNGKVYSCGYNGHGETGLTVLNNSYYQTIPIQITTNIGYLTIVAIKAAHIHSLFLTNNGQVYSCGYTGYNTIGRTSDNYNVPGLITEGIGSLTISAISGGYMSSFFVTNTGKVYCCGNNPVGNLGLGYAASASTPTLITTTTSGGTPTAFNNLNISAIACGYDHTIFLTNNGDIYSCGHNQYGQLGLDYYTSSSPYGVFNITYLPSSVRLLQNYGKGLYTVSYSSFTTSFEPFRCFNNNSSLNNPATWAANNYTSGTGVYNKTLNLVSGYNGDWLVIKFPVSIKLKRFDIKQISSALNRAPKNFRLYGSINGSSWTLLVDKTNAVYTDLFYVHTDMTQYPLEANQLYNHFGLVVNSLLGTSETTLSFDELFIYGSENVTETRNIINSTNKSLSFPITPLIYPNNYFNYNLMFPVPTYINNISTSSNIILQGNYTVNILDYSKTELIPNGGQINILNSTTKLTLSYTTNIEVNYHLLNPLPKGAQWTYSSENTAVYHLGNVGIGTKTPSYPLHINGDLFVSSTVYSGSGQTLLTTISDRRLKENIIKASYDKCYDNVKNIELYRFKFKDNTVNTNDINQLGFIAQEVQYVYPKAIEVNKIQDKTGEIPNLLSLNTTQLDYALYGAVKHLLEKIETLEEKL